MCFGEAGVSPVGAVPLITYLQPGLFPLSSCPSAESTLANTSLNELRQSASSFLIRRRLCASPYGIDFAGFIRILPPLE